jgi:hypothetical protein
LKSSEPSGSKLLAVHLTSGEAQSVVGCGKPADAIARDNSAATVAGDCWLVEQPRTKELNLHGPLRKVSLATRPPGSCTVLSAALMTAVSRVISAARVAAGGTLPLQAAARASTVKAPAIDLSI